MKRVLIDVNSVVPYYVLGKLSGIGRTTMELVHALDEVQKTLPFEIMLYSQNMKGIGAKNLQSRFKYCHIYLRNTENCNRLSSIFHLREFITKYDIQHIPHNYELVAEPSRCVVTIHDAMFFAYPESFLDHNNSRLLVPPFAKKAKAIITISEQSKRDIIQYMNVQEDKITVIPWGCNRSVYYPRQVGGNRFCGNNPYFISVSCDRGRKNTISTVKAFVEFMKNQPEHHLILVWNNPSEEVLILRKKNNLDNRIHFASNVPDKELGELYAGATASFFPSFYEGFGLPILESMACGVPVVTCRNSSLEEVGGDAAIYVEPLDVYAMSNVMERFENKDYNMDMLRELSIAQSSKFTWENCASKTIEVYIKCLGI